jgi:hypothetical protein
MSEHAPHTHWTELEQRYPVFQEADLSWSRCGICTDRRTNLNIVLDLHWWQDVLDSIDQYDKQFFMQLSGLSFGTTQAYRTLLAIHAATVTRAVRSPLTYAAILEKHLDTTVRTILRRYRQDLNPHHATCPSARDYSLADDEIPCETDAFLERRGTQSSTLFARCVIRY